MAMYGHSTEELAHAVANTPLDAHRQCANCSKLGCNRVVSTDAPNTALSFAAALTCGSDACRSAVRTNMKMMANAAAALDAASAIVDDAGDAFDHESIAVAAAAALSDSVVPAEGLFDRVSQAWRSTKSTMTGRKYWSTSVTRHTSKLGTSLLNVLRTMKERPLVVEMLNMVDADLGMRALITKQTLSKKVTIFVPSQQTLTDVLSNAPEKKLSEDVVEELLTSLMASTSGGLPLNSLNTNNPEISVVDMNRNTKSVITIRLAGNGGLKVRIPQLSKMAGKPEVTMYEVSEVIDAANGRIMLLN